MPLKKLMIIKSNNVTDVGVQYEKHMTVDSPYFPCLLIETLVFQKKMIEYVSWNEFLHGCSHKILIYMSHV